MAVSRSNTSKEVSKGAFKPKPGKYAANIIKKAKSTGIAGIRGPNYVARAMRPGGFSKGGGIGPAKAKT